MATKHFLLTDDGRIEEFAEDEAARVANGTTPLPQFADSQLRYVQVAYDERERDGGEIHVYTMGAIIGFDADGRFARADTVDGQRHELSQFEHDACVQFALRDSGHDQYRLN